MGNANSTINFRKSVVQLTTRTQPVEASDEAFWSQFWSDSATCVQDVFTLIPAAEIRALREESPSNLATLCYKAVEKLVQVAESGCRATKDEQMVQNCVRLLTRLLPYIFEDPDWRGFFWSTLPGQRRDEEDQNEENNIPLAQSLITALCNLLFCPDFTVSVNKKTGPDNPDDMSSIDSCEFIWAAGVGFTQHPHSTSSIEQNRTEILKLLLTCFSDTMYGTSNECHAEMNQWISYFTSNENRHALPLFTSLLNVVCSYDPIGYGLPYNYLMFSDAREPLVEVALHVLCVSLDCDQMSQMTHSEVTTTGYCNDASSSNGVHKSASECGESENLFIIYLSRIHREEDFKFILKGITRLLNNPLAQTYLPASTKRIHFHQELLVLFWKICDVNKKFMFHVLKSSDVLDILVPVLYYLNDARSDQSRVGLMHIGVFILLLLSGERNFGVRLNKPYNVRVPMDVPVFTGSHADLLIIVFHKIIITGHPKLHPLFDCLLTIIVNVSPYLKTLSMVSSTKLLHLLESFSSPWFLFAMPSNHHLMFFLLEVFNNIIQYQFDGNSNLVYTIIRKRQVFHQLASMPTDHLSICKAFNKSNKKIASHKEHPTIPPPHEGKEADEDGDGGVVGASMEGSRPATIAEPGTLQASLAATPCIEKMTEKSRAMNLLNEQMETNPEFGPESEIEKERKDLEKVLAEKEDDGGEVNVGASGSGVGSGGGGGDGVVGSGGDIRGGDGVGVGEERMGKEEELIKMDMENGEVTKSPLTQSPSLSSRLSTTSTTTASYSHKRKALPAIWMATPEWIQSWKQKLPLQTIMRLLQVLVPQVEKICIDRGLTDESEIIKFLQHGTLVGLLPVPHPILIRKYQANSGTTMWFRTYMWGVIYLRNVDPPIWYDTDVKLFEIQRV